MRWEVRFFKIGASIVYCGGRVSAWRGKGKETQFDTGGGGGGGGRTQGWVTHYPGAVCNVGQGELPRRQPFVVLRPGARTSIGMLEKASQWPGPPVRPRLHAQQRYWQLRFGRAHAC